MTSNPLPDARPALELLYAAHAQFAAAGWNCIALCSQPGAAGTGLPICAYASGGAAERVLIAGIHGREPAGAIALAESAAHLIEVARERPLLVMPLLNPWGYSRHERYGPSGQSVSDSDHWLGRAAAPACPEAEAITRFVMESARLAPAAAVLDLHEDPIYEAPGYAFSGRGSYFYATGLGAARHPLTQRIQQALRQSALPLVMTGVTRFGETLDQGMIVDSPDGSVDELLATRRGCSPVITTELVLHSPTDPPLIERVATCREITRTLLNF